jgi:hypothetical protein
MSIPIGGFAFAARNWREEDETEGSQDNSDRKCSMNAEGYGCRHRIWTAFISKVKAMRGNILLESVFSC